MARDSLSREAVLTQLKETPLRIAELTNGLTAPQLKTSPKPGEWAVIGILAHLRSCADVWGEAIGTILRQDRAKLRAINPRQWIKRTDYVDLDFAPSLAAFAIQRDELLRVLHALPEEAWLLSVTVTGAGSPLLRTVHSYAERLALHERAHVKQVERDVASLRA